MRRRSSRPAATRFCLLPLLLASTAALAVEGGSAPVVQPQLLEVTVNGQAADEPLLLLTDSEGALYASETMLRRWRIRPPSGEPVTYEGEPYHRIDKLSALRAAYSAAEQTLAIEARPEMFEGQSASLGAAQAIDMTPAGTGGFLNYDVFAEHVRGGINLNGAFEAGAFTRWGVGVTGFIVHAGDGGPRILRLDTSWTIDRPGKLSSIRIGDGITVSGSGAAPLRFGGIQFARNFAVQPGFVTMPLPVLQGSAAVPSVVDVYVNNTLQGSREVTPGPFELTNVPVQSGGGTVQLVTRDLLGRQVVSEQSYYASSALLRRGLHDFSYEVGFLRSGFGTASGGYGPLIASTSHRYGLSDDITVEGHAQVSAERQLAGAGVSLSLFDLGMLGAAASVSRSERGSGAFATGSFERRTSGLSLGLRAEYASAGYAFIGMSEENRPARFSAQAFADLPFSGGSVGFNLIHRDQRTGADESLAGIFANVRVMDNATVQLFARRAVSGEARTALGAHLSLALGGRRSAAASLEHRGGAFSHNLSYQDAAPSGMGSGYRASASFAGGKRSMDSVYTYNAGPASFSGHMSHVGGRMGVRVGATGALGMIGSRPFASRALGGSFAEVRVDGHAGVRVYADNQLVGTTDASGSIGVPSLRAFDRNIIRIEEGDLPLDTRIAETERAVRPFARSGAVISFSARRERGVLMQVKLEDGTPLPPGAMVRIEGAAESHVVASGGEVYVATMGDGAALEASWAGGSCRFEAVVPESDDPQPRIAGLVCRR